MSEQTHLSELDSVEDYNSAPVGTLIHDHPDGLYCYRRAVDGSWLHDHGVSYTSAELASDPFAREVQSWGDGLIPDVKPVNPTLSTPTAAAPEEPGSPQPKRSAWQRLNDAVRGFQFPVELLVALAILAAILSLVIDAVFDTTIWLTTSEWLHDFLVGAWDFLLPTSEEWEAPR